MKRFSVLFFIVSILFFSSGILTASAHEVYVLDQSAVHFDLQVPPPDFIATVMDHLPQFAEWGLLVIAIILIVFFISINQPLERLLAPVLVRLKKYAPHIAQVTLGAALFASGYYHAIFGTELPLSPLFGSIEPLVAYALMVLGLMLVFGILPRLAALCATVLFVGLTVHFGIYMLNYMTYLGEALTLLMFGGAYTMFVSFKRDSLFSREILPAFHKYKFLIMRVFFGVSLIYASLYAKFIHGALALDVVSKYNLTHYFPFDPVFLVLGAMLIEILLGLFFIFGFEIRFASLFFLTFLTMSLVFFGETVWPHIVLIGTAVAMFAHGYDAYTFSVRLEKDKSLEPTL